MTPPDAVASNAVTARHWAAMMLKWAPPILALTAEIPDPTDAAEPDVGTTPSGEKAGVASILPGWLWLYFINPTIAAYGTVVQLYSSLVAPIVSLERRLCLVAVAVGIGLVVLPTALFFSFRRKFHRLAEEKDRPRILKAVRSRAVGRPGAIFSGFGVGIVAVSLALLSIFCSVGARHAQVLSPDLFSVTPSSPDGLPQVVVAINLAAVGFEESATCPSHGIWQRGTRLSKVRVRFGDHVDAGDLPISRKSVDWRCMKSEVVQIASPIEMLNCRIFEWAGARKPPKQLIWTGVLRQPSNISSKDALVEIEYSDSCAWPGELL